MWLNSFLFTHPADISNISLRICLPDECKPTPEKIRSKVNRGTSDKDEAQLQQIYDYITKATMRLHT